MTDHAREVARVPEDRLGRIVATGQRCPECGAPMLRRATDAEFLWICTDASCGETYRARDLRIRAEGSRRRHD